MKTRKQYGYNERLFSSGIRRRLHLARFHWLSQSVQQSAREYASVLELGCFDGKALHFLPHPPSRYLGLDANWEGGLELAEAAWKDKPYIQFRECHTPEEMRLNDSRFDISICMDTLEHVPPAMVEPYLAQLA